MSEPAPIAQAYNVEFALHTLGWKAFQDLCAQVCEEHLRRTVSIYREAQDGGQDAVFLLSAAGDHKESTVQCKFSGKSELRLKVSDISGELDAVGELVSAGRAHAYYLMTSMGVDAPVAAEIRDILKERGVKEPHVLGREWITGQIKDSARLRALVPRVYGLGDLSTIVDERSAAQTRALLGHLVPGLRVYVPTSSHRTAVRTLGEHKLVLLLGAPASGKSMLAAILATMAIDSEGLQCFKCEGPLDLQSRWNPNEPKRLYWIDDAFGPNQMRHDYVDAWTSFMPKMRTALEHGSHFILTSRTHIWNEARHKLGTRNHPLLANGASVVNVGLLSPEERQQILYNHIKAGQQPKQWKERAKPFLSKLSEEVALLPEIARRLGNPSFTANVRVFPNDLTRFVRDPQEFLKETFQELEVSHRAAMTLVFLYRSRLPPHLVASEECKLVAEKYATSVSEISEALHQLESTFLVRRTEGGQLCWGFFHPTFADAISSILSARPDLVELYLKGARLETMLAEAVCEGAGVVDAVIIPTGMFETLVSRILEMPDSRDLNERLFQFLVRRAPNMLVERVLRLAPEILDREGANNIWTSVSRHSDVLLRAKAFELNLLGEQLRESTCAALEREAVSSLDVSFISDQKLLALFRPHELMRLTIKLVRMLDQTIPNRIDSIEDQADPDGDIEEQFDSVKAFVDELQWLADEDDSLDSRLSDVSSEIASAIERVERRKSKETSESFFSSVPDATAREKAKLRSIFSDVED